MKKAYKALAFLFCMVLGAGLSAQTSIKDLMEKGESEKVKSHLDITPQLAMSSNDYPVTAGDIYTLAFALNGAPVTYVISVDTTYRIRVANFAILDAKGLTFNQLKNQVETIVTKNAPMSGVQFVLTTPAVFTLTIKGEVGETSTAEAWALTRLSAVIGPYLTGYSSTRNVQVTSLNGKTDTYDLFLAKRFGDLSEDPYVRPGDVITINKAGRRVTVSGEVRRPGTYELLEGENLKKLTEYYGDGLTDFADNSRISVTRYNQGIKSTYMNYLTEDVLVDDYKLFDHDTVYISNVNELRSTVFVEGAIFSGDAVSAGAMNRIPVQINEKTNYAFFIRSIRNMFGANSDLDKAYVIRNGERIAIDINKILYDVTYYSDLIVEPYDTLEIPFKQYFVTVAGAVKIPGRYPYIKDRGWDYYVGLAGGFDKTMNSGHAVKIVDADGKVLKKGDPITPETTITASTNAFTYYFNTYAPVVTTTLSVLTSFFTIMLYVENQ